VNPVASAVDFFNHLNMLYGTVTEFCTPQEVRLFFPIFSVLVPSLNMAASRSARSCPRALGEAASSLSVFTALIIDTSPKIRYEYLWEDGVRYKRPTKLPAPEYVDALMNWAQNILDDEAIFPNTIGMSSHIIIPKFCAADGGRRCVVPSDIQRHCAHHCASIVSRVRAHIQQPL